MLYFVLIIDLLLFMTLTLMYVAPNNILTKFANCYICGIILLFCDSFILMHVIMVIWF